MVTERVFVAQMVRVRASASGMSCKKKVEGSRPGLFNICYEYLLSCAVQVLAITFIPPHWPLALGDGKITEQVGIY